MYGSDCGNLRKIETQNKIKIVSNNFYRSTINIIIINSGIFILTSFFNNIC